MKIHLLAGLLLLSFSLHGAPVGTAFTYQGELIQLSQPAEGVFDFRFELFDLDSGGVALTAPLQPDNVVVVNGVFSVELDFGASPFDGKQLWLEIGVREGASEGEFTGLLPRQILTATPYAVQAATVSEGSITMASIAEGSVASTQIADFGVTTIDIANNAITQAKLASNSVGSEEIIDGAIVAVDVDSSEVQRRVAGACDEGSVMVGINEDGSVICTAFSIPPVITTVDISANVGSDTSIAIGVDGLPVISYRDRTAFALKVAKCNDLACAFANETITTVDNPIEMVGFDTSIAIGSDGFPIIAYYDSTMAALKVAKCNDIACADNDETINQIDGGGVGGDPSIAIGHDNLPVIAYFDSIGAIRVAKCNDTACADNDETITIVYNPANYIGEPLSMAIGDDGFPVIAYYDATAESLEVLKCNDAACEGNDESIFTVDGDINDVGEYNSIAIGVDGNPVIGYFDTTAEALKVMKCNDAACVGNDETITTVDDPANEVGRHVSLAIGGDGFPVLAYRDSTARALKVVKCNDTACAGNDETITILDDSANNVGGDISLAIGIDGVPIIGYRDGTAESLKVVHCPTASCR